MILVCHQFLQIFTLHDLRKEALDQYIFRHEQNGDFDRRLHMLGLVEKVSRKHPILVNDGINGGLDIKVHCSKKRQVTL